MYIEDNASSEDIVNSGIDKSIVFDVLNKVDRSEYKRRQAPPGVRITARGFGKDRRYPITNKYLQ